MLASENKLSNSRFFSILSKGLLESGHVFITTLAYQQFPFSITSKEMEQGISGMKVKCWVPSRNGSKSNLKASFSSPSQKALPSDDHRETSQLPKSSAVDWHFPGHPKDWAESINCPTWRQSPWKFQFIFFWIEQNACV